MGKKIKINHSWSVKVFFITFILAIIFSVISEAVLSTATLIASIILAAMLLVVGVVFDMIGVAVAAAQIEPFISMNAKKIRGAKQGMMLVKKAEKVSSLTADVIGDICGILLGATSAGIVFILFQTNTIVNAVIFSIFINSLLAALTVYGKAIGKELAIKHPTMIVLSVGKILSIFTINKNKTLE